MQQSPRRLPIYLQRPPGSPGADRTAGESTCTVCGRQGAECCRPAWKGAERRRAMAQVVEFYPDEELHLSYCSVRTRADSTVHHRAEPERDDAAKKRRKQRNRERLKPAASVLRANNRERVRRQAAEYYDRNENPNEPELVALHGSKIVLG